VRPRRPTCDSADVLYERKHYDLPVSLEIGDKVLIEGTGAYTATMRRSHSRLCAAADLSHLNLESGGSEHREPAMPAPGPFEAHRERIGMRRRAMITIRHGELPSISAAREALLDGAFGDCRFAKTAERLREDRRPEAGFVACATVA